MAKKEAGNSDSYYEFIPPEVGVPNYTTPHAGYVLITEKHSTTAPDYYPMGGEIGAVYTGKDSGKYSFPLYLVKEDISADGKWAFRFWCSDRDAKWQNTWNYGIKFIGDDVSYPLYYRDFVVARSKYVPEAALSALCAGIIAINLTSGGSGYQSKPTVTITGSNATADCKILNGKVVSVYLTSPDTSGNVSSATVTFTGGSPTVAATASVVLHNNSAKLIKETVENFPEDHPLYGRYILVRKVYGVFPGPWNTQTDLDIDGMAVMTKQRLQLEQNILGQATETIVNGVWTRMFYKGSDLSEHVATEVNIVRTIPGAWVTEKQLAEDGKVLIISSRYNVVGDIVSGESLANGVWIRIESRKIQSALVALEVKTTREIPGNTLRSSTFDESGNKVNVSRTLKERSSIVIGETLEDDGATWARTTLEPIQSNLVVWEIVNRISIPGNTIRETKTDIDGYILTLERQLMKEGDVVSMEGFDNGVWTRQTKDGAQSSLVAYQITSSRGIPGFVLESSKLDEDGMTITVTRQLKEASSIEEGEALNNNLWVRVSKEELNSTLIAWEVKLAREVPGNILKSYEVDAESRIPVEITTQLVEKPEAITSATGEIKIYKPVSNLVGWLITRTFKLPEGGKTIEYTRLIRFVVPGLIQAQNVTCGIIQKLTGESLPYFNIARRAQQSKQVVAYITDTYTDSQPVADLQTVIQPTDIIYDGVLFNISEQGVLSDSFEIQINTASDDPIWGVVVESFTFPATTPTATEYLALVGQKITIGCEVSPWLAGLWKKSKIEIIAE